MDPYSADHPPSVRITHADPTRPRFTLPAESSALVSVKSTKRAPPRLINMIPREILDDPHLNEAISHFPLNYNFEIPKCIWQIRKLGVHKVALQMPEGLQRFAPALRQVLLHFGPCQEVIILADVTYGACCVEDQVAHHLGCDLLIHYGHSCLVPITMGKLPVLYVFVEINLPANGLLDNLTRHFQGKKIALLATIQFISTLHQVKATLNDLADTNLYIPQIRPLSPGEVLGCTSPRLPSDTDVLIFVADGRFHLEAAMIANPTIPAYRYDPFTRHLFREGYDHAQMLQVRKSMIERAQSARHWGIILGTLGRQGSTAVVDDLERKLQNTGRQTIIVLMKEIRAETLRSMPEVEAWVQTSCPRLSIDWGYMFDVPVLTPYEVNVMLGEAPQFNTNNPDGSYPMNYYAAGEMSLVSGPWTPGFHLRPPKKESEIKRTNGKET